ncbi:MAG: S46 family peptidase [Flavobacteriales bacterium]
MKKIVTVLTIIYSITIAQAKEGIWIPMLLNNNIAEMQAMGCELSAEDIYSVNHSSLKDAIVSFGGFCTGEFISSSGLVLTNHHCGYRQIQKQSSLEHNYLKEGFWANNTSEELMNPGLFVKQLVYMEDVTNAVLGAEDEEAAISAMVEAKTSENPDFDYEVVPFFYGNQFFLLATKKYNDVRLVGAPPSSIGKFGADTDNWVFPRHTGDFSLFRVYDDNGLPFTPAQHLKVNIGSRTPGEFTMVLGYPGTTQEYLPAVAMDQLVNEVNAYKVEVRSVLLGIMDREMRKNEQAKIQYASKYASTANGWKKWIGQIEGIEFSNGIDRKRKLEADFTARIAADPSLWMAYSSVLNDLNIAYTKRGPSAQMRTAFIETIYYGMPWFNFMNSTMRIEESDVLKAAVLSFQEGFNRTISEEATTKMLELALEDLPELTTYIQGSAGEFSKAVHDELDALFLSASSEQEFSLDEQSVSSDFVSAVFGVYRSVIAPAYNEHNTQISSLQATYMKALIAAFPERQFYPDANSTLRVTYGKLEGVEPRDAVSYGTTTYLEGVMAKYQPGDYEFDVPAKLIDLYETKDYGPYAENGKVPVCNIASNHTTGGNSGSPVLNGRGELIGLNFDRIWEGTMSDVNFDERICRNIMVDSRYVLFIIDKFAGQKWLIDEMSLVQ